MTQKQFEVTHELNKILSNPTNKLEKALVKGKLDKQLVVHIAIRAKRYDKYVRDFLKISRVSRSVKIKKNPKGDTSSRLNVEEVNPNGYYRLSPNKNNV